MSIPPDTPSMAFGRRDGFDIVARFPVSPFTPEQRQLTDRTFRMLTEAMMDRHEDPGARTHRFLVSYDLGLVLGLAETEDAQTLLVWGIPVHVDDSLPPNSVVLQQRTPSLDEWRDGVG